MFLAIFTFREDPTPVVVGFPEHARGLKRNHRRPCMCTIHRTPGSKYDDPGTEALRKWLVKDLYPAMDPRDANINVPRELRSLFSVD